MTKRNIRLKEFSGHLNKIHIPSETYLKASPALKKNQAYSQKTDANGLMTTPYQFKHDYHVILIGDSFVENLFVDESKRITNYLEKSFLQHTKKIKIDNAGVSGATGLNLLNTVINKLVFIKPDLIIYVQPSCDFAALIYEKGYYNDSQFFSNLVPSTNQDKPKYETISENSYQIFNNISILSKVCEVNNIELCIATCCSNSSKRQLKMMNDIIRENSHILGYDLIDLDNLIPRNSDIFYDKQHITEQGSKFIADILYSYIDRKTSRINSLGEFRTQPVYFEKENETLVGECANLEFYNKLINPTLIIKLKNNISMTERENFLVKIDIHSEIDSKVEIDSYIEEFPMGYELEKSIQLKPKYYGRIKLCLDTEILESIDIEYCHLEFIFE
ncbi:SGNH/GDSL hydrolase family protein [Actinobacillus porcinus]|uniref:SGNH/GDSL hydrolase family protein n=1 Tax=Actinobacillus porcinus TaxID=51048 RepID=UPI002352AB35|nr:SGNH/GDSL hydrolase family protein [Actinobacillus porcinus]